jgi:hypothetical protein
MSQSKIDACFEDPVPISSRRGRTAHTTDYRLSEAVLSRASGGARAQGAPRPAIVIDVFRFRT